MMNLFDALVLARTKLRNHRIRTSITVAVAGMLFGLIVALVMIIQGIFTSVDGYSNSGLNNRTLLTVAYLPQASSFDEYSHLDDPDFVREVEAAYKADIAKKQAAAKRYSVEYSPAMSDPSPIGTDPATKQKIITNEGASSKVVQQIAQQRRQKLDKKFSITDYLKPYKSVTLRSYQPVMPQDGLLLAMDDSREGRQPEKDQPYQPASTTTPTAPLVIVDASVTKPFIVSGKFDPSKGEIPVILPYLSAEKLLGLKKLAPNASSQERLDRLHYVRAHVGEATTSFCYRNEASQALLAQATAQQNDSARAVNGGTDMKPTLLYNVPDKSSCAAVTIKSDTRSMTEKQMATNQELFEKAVGTWQGDPQQRKVTVRGVGISGDQDVASATLSAAALANNLLNSSLGYGTWAIPKDLFDMLPVSARPTEIFSKGKDSKHSSLSSFLDEAYLVEFGSKAEARALLERTGAFSGAISDVIAMPYGSGTLFIDEMRTWVERALFWTLVVVGVFAVIILWGIIGRTIADSRRESAVFRAIGATRADITTIYGLYALLLSFRVVIFAAMLGVAIALPVDLVFSESATIGAQLAYAAVDTTTKFHFISLASWYLGAIVGVIVLAGLIASILPIILASRRNPIGDMRED